MTLTVTLSGSGKQKFQPLSNLSEFVKHDNYSGLYTELTKNRASYNEESLVYYDIIMKSVTNKPEESNRLIAQFRDEFSGTDDAAEYYLIRSEYNNELKLCNYKRLKEIGSVLISKFKASIDSSDYVELQDDHVRYTFLEHEKAIVLDKTSDTKLRIKRDLAGYTLLTVKGSNDSTVNLVFDTGANVNVLAQSSAEKLNLRLLPDSKIYVMGATGERNEARIGIAENLAIGNMEIHNAEFVVFADSLLTFAGGRYVINGAVGFPIFSRFEEIIFDDSALTILRNPALKSGEPNMFIKSDDYILAVEYNNSKYPFFFDTGNMHTYFTKIFYENDSTSFSRLQDTVRTFGGVGGMTSVKAKQAEAITVRYSGKNFTLSKPFIELEAGQQDKNFFGSIGKDFVNCYPRKIMNFKEARFVFE